MKRFLSLILCFALACTMGCFFVSCDKGETETTETKPETTAQIEVEDKILALDDLSKFVIIRNDENYINEAAAKYLKGCLAATSSLDMTLKSDLVTDSIPGYEEAEFEIIVGPCDRKESAKLNETFRYNDYGYAMIGNKLVISVGSEAGNYQAMKHFIENVAKTCSGETFFDNNAQNYFFSG